MSNHYKLIETKFQSKLITAIKEKDHKEVESALKQGADPNKKLSMPYLRNIRAGEKITTLYYAWMNSDTLEIMELLLRYGANINIPLEDLPLRKDPVSKASPLLLSAVIGGDFQAVQLFLEYGADINMRYENGETVLDHVRDNLMFDPLIHNYLVDHGAKATKQNKDLRDGEVQRYSNFTHGILADMKDDYAEAHTTMIAQSIILTSILGILGTVGIVIISLVFMVPIGMLNAMWRGFLWMIGS